MENQFGHLVVVEREFVAHGIVMVMLLAEIDIKVPVVGVVGVGSGSGIRVAVIIHDLRHGNGNTSVGNFPVVSAWCIFVLRTKVIVIFALIPGGMQQRGYNAFCDDIL